MYFGKMSPESKTQWYPSIFIWGGMLFINWIRRGIMIPLPEWIINEMLIWGMNPYGD